VVSRCPVTTAVIMAWMVSSRSADSGEPYVSCRMHCSLPTHFRDSGQVAAPAGCLLLLSTPVLMRRVLPFAKNAPVHVSFLREIANRARRAARPGLSRGIHSRFLGVSKDVDGRAQASGSDAVLQTAMPGHDRCDLFNTTGKSCFRLSEMATFVQPRAEKYS